MLVEELIDLAQSIQKQKAEEQITEVKSAHLGCPNKKHHGESIKNARRISITHAAGILIH